MLRLEDGIASRVFAFAGPTNAYTKHGPAHHAPAPTIHQHTDSTSSAIASTAAAGPPTPLLPEPRREKRPPPQTGR